MKHKTRDGYPIEIGMRVWTYDWDWATIEDSAHNRHLMTTECVLHPSSGTDEGAWWDTATDGIPTRTGPVSVRRRQYDCSRMWAKEPRP